MKLQVFSICSRLGSGRVVPKSSVLLVLFMFGLSRLLSAQTLQHEWSFNESGGTTAFDSIGSSNITVVGGASLGGGVLTLPGGAGNYAQFPNGMLSTYTNSITIETWLTDTGGQEWSRAWSFGNNTGDYIDLIPTAGSANNIGANAGEVTGFWTEFNHNGVRDAVSFGPVPSGVEEYITMVIDVPNQTARIYLNGGRVATAAVAFAPSALGFTVNNWLGQDEYNDAVFQGTFDEMRIWSGTVSQRYISASAVAGPGVVINNLTPTSTSLTVPATLAVAASQPATFSVTLPQTASTNLLATADATNWISSNPSVLTVDSRGMITGVAPGTATVTATVAGAQATSGSITVIPQMLEHRWSFNEPSGSSTAVDSVSGADITLQGSCTLGGGVLSLPGGAGNYAQFPNGIVSSNYSITIETWLTDNAGQTWSRAWSFGGPGGASLAGQFIRDNYIDLIPTAGASGGMWNEVHSVVGGQDDTIDVISAGHIPMPTAVEQYIVFTYSAPQQTCTMYSNGVPISIGTGISVTPASLGFTYNNYLGLDQWNDAPFNGTYDEMRIWDGVLSPVYMLVSAAAGPNVVVTNTTPQALTVSAGTSLLGSQTEQATATGNFIQATGINITSAVTNWTSSNRGILTVNSSGLITGVSGGTATVSVTVDGVTGTSSLIMVATTSPTPSQVFSNTTAVVGDNVVLNAQVYGGSLAYQWSFNSLPLTGATNSTLTLTNIQISQSGTYNLLITNTAGHTNVSAVVTVVPPILRNEWSFNESGGTTAVDSISASNITLLGGCSLGGGVLTLPGGAGNYAQFPNGILSTYSNSITIETWFTDNGGLTWARPWSFGGSTAGPNNNFSHGNYIDLIPTAGNANGINGGFWTEFNHGGTNTDAYQSTPLPIGTEEYVVVTYQVWDRTAHLYLNGAQVATAGNVIFSPADMGFTYNNFLGLDQYDDPIFAGTFDEMRIWNGAVSPLYLAIAAVAGPGVVVNDLTPASVVITTPNSSMIGGETQQAVAAGNFTQASGVDVALEATNWVSSNPSVLIVNSNGLITAVGTGNATVSATVNGVTGTSPSINVPASGPIIATNPAAAETLIVGATLTASVAAEGTQPFVYLWFTNGSTVPLTISTSPILTVHDVQLAANGNTYTCVVSNHYGTATSSALALAVVAPSTYEQAMLQYQPVAFWPLNETGGATAYDVIGGNNGTYEGNYALDQAGPTNSFFGASSLGVGFDGSSAYVDIPEGPLNITGAITVVAWVYPLNAIGFDGIIGHGDDSWRMSYDAQSQPGANDGNAQSDAGDSAVISQDVWHQIVYSYNGFVGQANNGALYIDGVLAANNTVTATPPGDDLDVWIGGAPDYPTSRLINANIADVSVFAYSFTAAQVTGLYNGTFVATPATLSISKTSAGPQLNWQVGTLLQAPALTGPWTTNSAAVPPYTVPVTSGNQFFKLLVNP